mgnify:CR=1 FL=1
MYCFRFLQKGRLCQRKRSSLAGVIIRAIECFDGFLTTGSLGSLSVLMGFSECGLLMGFFFSKMLDF